MPCGRVILGLTLLLALPAGGSAQDRTAAHHLQNAERLVAAGDTAAALEELERARELEPDRARVHYELGRLYARGASAVDTDFRDRRHGEKALLEAIRLDPDEPEYLVELGRLRIKQHMNTDARRVLELALERAEERGDPDPDLLSEIHYHLGWIHEVFYERQRDRRLTGRSIVPDRGQRTAPGAPGAGRVRGSSVHRAGHGEPGVGHRSRPHPDPVRTPRRDRTGRQHDRVGLRGERARLHVRAYAGLRPTRFAGPVGDFRSVVDDYRHLQPASYANIPSIPEYQAIPVQIARFRGDRADRVAVEIHASLPLETLARDLDMATTELSTGFFLLDPEGRMIVRRIGEEVIPQGGAESRNDLKSWRLSLPPAGLLVAAVEARDALTWRTAASRDTFTAAAFPEHSLAVSDILLADDLRRLAPEPARRTDLDILPSTRLSYTVGQPVHIYYEVYGLDVDAENVASFDVEVSVRVVELHRKGLIAQFLGPLADAWGFSIAGDDRVELRYHRETGLAGRDRVVDYLSLDLKEAPPGVYEVRVRVYDRLQDRLAGRVRQFRVVE